jgi:GT2 family glycosyltransferase
MNLSIIYVNYNTTTLLIDSLESLKYLHSKLSYEVIIVDNASRNFEKEPIITAYPKAKIIESNENLGFGRGNNLGAAAASGEYLWILNTDTIVPENNNLTALIDFLDNDTSYAAALPMLTNAAGEIQPAQVSHFPSVGGLIASIPIRLIVKILPMSKRLFAKTNLDYAPLKTADVEVVVAAALVVRTTVFHQVGGFSSEYFMFYEDSDLCKKIAEAGFKTRHFLDAHITHLWGKSITGNASFVRRKKLYFASQNIYFKKWSGLFGLVTVKLLRAPLILRYKLFQR